MKSLDYNAKENDNKNKWCDLKVNRDGNYIAEEDKNFICKLLTSEKYKKLVKKDTNLELKLDIPPLHFIGDIKKAKILILSLNPGYNKNYRDFCKGNKTYYEKIIKNLKLEEVSFFTFDNEDKGNYWNRLKFLFDEKYKKILCKKKKSEDDKKELRNYLTPKIALVEFFPYHSAKYSDNYDKLAVEEEKIDYLPSQKFVFNIIKERIEKKDAIIVITRSRAKWCDAISSLKSYDKCYVLSNPRNPSFKKQNIYKINCGEDITKELKIIN